MRIHPLLVAAAALILLPFALTAVGLTTTSAPMSRPANPRSDASAFTSPSEVSS